MLKVLIYWSDDDYNPSVIITDRAGAFNLWWCLVGNPTLVVPISNPTATKVVLVDLISELEIQPQGTMSLSNPYNK